MITDGLRVDVAFEEDPDATPPAWHDITDYVRLSSGVSITRGRQDPKAQPSTGTCSLVLDNSDGRFTSGKSGGPYGDWVIPGRKLRVTWRPDSGSGNLLTDEDASFEGGTTGNWYFGYFGTPANVTLANSSTRASDGSRSLLVTFPTASAGAGCQLGTDVVKGRTYTLHARVYVPAGGPAVELADPFGNFPSSSASSTTGAWETLSTTWEATSHVIYIVVRSTAATTSGQQVWLDSFMLEEGPAASTFTTGNAIHNRFTGHVESWPTEAYPVRAAYTRIAAHDRLSALGYADEFRSVPEESILGTGTAPMAYYPLFGESDASAFGSVASTPQGSLRVIEGPGETFDPVGGTGPGTDGSASPKFMPESTSSGTMLRAALTSGVGFLNRTLRCTIRHDGSASREAVAASIMDAYGARVDVGVDSTGHAFAAAYNPWEGAEVWRVTSSVQVDDNRTHSLAVTEAYSGGTTQVTLNLDGDNTDTDTVGGQTDWVAVALGVGGSLDDWTRRYFAGTISHVAAWTGALTESEMSDHHAAMMTGYEGESTDDRIARYASWVGIATGEQNLETGYGTVGHRDTGGVAPVTAMQDVAVTEGGALLIDREGKLAFYNRRHNITADPALTVAGNDDDTVISDASLRNVVNDVTVEVAGGGSVRVADEASIARYRRRAERVTMYADTDSQASSAAYNRIARWATPTPGVDVVTVDVGTLPAVDHTGALALDVGDKLEVTTLPSTALPGSSFVGWVEGYTETIGSGTWRTEFALSPVSATGGDSRPWILADATWSELGATTVPAY